MADHRASPQAHPGLFGQSLGEAPKGEVREIRLHDLRIVCDSCSVKNAQGVTENTTSVMEDAHLWLGGVKVVSESL